MFYSEYVLAKKGALGKVWLAAHWQKKLTRNQMARSNIVEACNSIIKPPAPMALRTSGHLLLGVVRIHDGKQKSLMHDCSDALVKIKLAFRPGTVDMPASKSTASAASITMQETFADDFEGDFDPMSVDGFGDDAQANLNIGTAEEITLAEDNLDTIDATAPEMSGFGEDALENLGSGELEAPPFLDADDRPEEIEMGRERDADASFAPMELDESNTFGSEGGAAALKDAGLDTTLTNAADISEIPQDDISGMGTDISGMDANMSGFGDDFGFGNVSDVAADQSVHSVGNLSAAAEEEPPVAAEEQGPTPFGDLTLDTVEEEPKVAARPIKKKRKIMVDSALEIPSAVMRKGLEPHGPDDITRQPYRKVRGPFEYDRLPFSDAMHKWRLEDNSAEALLQRPSIKGLPPVLAKLFTRHFVTKPRPGPVEDGEMFVDQQDVEVGRRESGAVAAADDFPLDDYDAVHPEEQRPEDPSMYDPEPIADDSLLGDVSSLDQTSNSIAANSTMDQSSSVFDLGLADDHDQPLADADELDDAHITKRTQQMMANLRAGFKDADELSYQGITEGRPRRTAAAVFFELLVLKTKDYVDVEQPEPYADITIRPTELLLADA